LEGAELLEAQAEGVEKGVNVAIPMLNEQTEFARQMIEGARHAPLDDGLVYWERLLGQAEEQIETLRRFLNQRPNGTACARPGDRAGSARIAAEMRGG
jgi:hypothetical protein